MRKTKEFYTPFGVGLKNRDFSSEKYRYGFNGMEKDDELKGVGNSYDYKMRFFDNRLGRFFTVDPIAANYPWVSAYAFAINSPINFIDLDGLQPAKEATNYGQNHIFGNTYQEDDVCSDSKNINWHVHGISTLDDVQAKIDEFKSEGAQIKNVVLFAHSGAGQMAISGENIAMFTTDPDFVFDASSLINTEDVETYIEYKKAKAEGGEAESKFFADYEAAGGDVMEAATKMTTLTKFDAILNSIEPGGKAVLAMCNLGDCSGEEGTNEIGLVLSKLNPNITLLISRDYVTGGAPLLDRGLITSQYWEDGFTRYKNGNELIPQTSSGDTPTTNVRLNGSSNNAINLTSPKTEAPANKTDE